MCLGGGGALESAVDVGDRGGGRVDELVVSGVGCGGSGRRRKFDREPRHPRRVRRRAVGVRLLRRRVVRRVQLVRVLRVTVMVRVIRLAFGLE